MTFSHFLKGFFSFERQDKLLVSGIIFLYCLAYASTRLLISSSMGLDEAEQFLNGSVFQWGYHNQAPLYSWIVRAVSIPFGVNLVTLIIIKYSLLFLFYFVVYHTARSFQDEKTSLLITASLVLFPLYSYEFNRDLSHSILVVLMACSACFLYIKLLIKRKTIHYVLIGLSIGLGILSKYNYVFFLSALILASISSREGRQVIFDRRIFLAMLISLLVVLPHFTWLVKENFPSLHFALHKARIGEMKSGSFPKVLTIIGGSYLEVLLFLLVFILFFSWDKKMRSNETTPFLKTFRWLAFYGMIIPLIAMLILQTGSFKGRWLAPVLFTLPLAMFSTVGVDMKGMRFKVFSALCGLIVVAVLIARLFVGLMPDLTGKVERIHIPFKTLSLQLTQMLKERGMNDFRDLTIISDDPHLVANVMAWIPGMKFVSLQNALENRDVQRNVLSKRGIIVWNISKLGENLSERCLKVFPSVSSINVLKAPYIHSKKFPPYMLGVAIIPRSDNQ